MSTLKSLSHGRSSSPSPAGLLRSHRYADATDHSPWRRGPACHGGGDRTRSSLSPFERSARTTTPTTHRIYREVSPAGDDHVTAGRNGGIGEDDDDDDYWMCDDDAFDGDDGGEGLSQEEVRSSSWLRGFLARMGELSPEEVEDPAAAVICPACKGGPGGSLRYRGFQGLLDHARTVRAKRVRLHRRFAEILEDELRARRGRQGGGGSEQAAATDEKREGLACDQAILWPPMVVVLNTRLGKQEGSDKWVGMGNRDLLECFREYEPVKARSAYGSRGHCGASLLVFDGTVLGYLQAQRLHSQFIQEGRGKHEWYKQKPWKQATENHTEKRLLYGYMASKEEELRMFCTYSGDKQKLKYEMKPYQEVVGNPLKEMYGRSRKHALLEREIAKEIEHNKSLEKTCEQRAMEIEAIRRMLNEQSDEHNKEIESLNEYNEKLNSKLKESELERKKMLEQISSLNSSGDGEGETSSTELAKHFNLGDGEQDRPDDEMDELAEEQLYLGACDPGDKRKKRPLQQGVHCN